MRLLLVTGLFPPDIGGPATHVADLRGELAARGHDVTVLTLGDASTRSTSDPDGAGPVVRLPRGLPLPARMARTSGWVAANARRFDAVYATGLQVEAVAGARAARSPVVAGARAGRTAVVVKVVGDLAWERGRRLGWTAAGFDDFRSTREPSWRVRAIARLQNATLRAADEITAPSEALARTIRGWLGGPAPVEVIPNGVARPAAAERPPTPTFVYVGRLIPHKRVDRIVEAAAGVPGARLEVLGDGPERDQLADLVGSLGVEERVALRGATDHGEVMRAVARSTALVLASHYEGLPHVVIEALACGVPVISPAVGGVPEVVTDGRSGLVLGDASVGSLGAAMSRLVEDPALERKLRAGAAETGAEWTIERAADRILGLVDRAIAGRPRAVFFGGSTVAPPTPDVLGRLEVLSRRFRTTVVGSGRVGIRGVGSATAVAMPNGAGALGAASHLALGGVAAVAAAATARRRGAIVCQSPFEAIGVEALTSLLPRALRPGVVVEVHGDWRTAATLYGPSSRARFAALAERLAARAVARADRVRAVGAYTASLARGAGYEGAIDRFPAFADYGAFALGGGHGGGHGGDDGGRPEPDPGAVAFVGSLERVKGIDVLLDAWPLVVARSPGARLRIAGGGALADDVARAASALDGVEVLDPIGPQDVRSLLDRSAVVAVPSRSEGLGRVVLEAFARSRPVVASDVGGIGELVDADTGALVPPEDAGALADAIAALLEDPARAAAMGERGRARFDALEPGRAFEDGIERLARWVDAR